MDSTESQSSDRDALVPLIADWSLDREATSGDLADAILACLAQRGALWDEQRLDIERQAIMADHESIKRERDAAVARAEAAERERDAYRKAKQENDERYMTERDAARAEAAALREALTHLQADVNHAICWFSGGGDIHTVVHALTKARDLARQALAGATQQRQGEGS